ncbi:MAG: transglutaminase domain-containing protein [Gammaproteobacteria bacterium]
MIPMFATINGQLISRFGILVLAVIASACTSIDLEQQFQPDPELQRAVIDQNRDLFPGIDPLHLSEDIKQFLDRELNDRVSAELKVTRLQELLFGEDYLDFAYSDARTHTAAEAFSAREGNCLSAMNLYVAMARYAGLDARFQTVAVQPSWDLRGNLLVLSQHINATGRITVRRRYVVDFTPEIALQQLTSRIIDDRQARSLYFNNLGVESLVDGAHEQALAYFKNALYLDPESQYAWNNIGSTYNQLGNAELAEYGYKMAFYWDNSNATAINNLARFYRKRGDNRLAREYADAVQRFSQRNPYFHYSMGQRALAAGDYVTALDSFRRAARLKEVEPEFFVAMGSTYERLGDQGRAARMRSRAAELIAINDELYEPSSQKMRIIDSATILRDSSPGLSIHFPTGTSSRSN